MKRRPRLFYGWVIVAVSLVTVAVSYGVRYSFSRFFLVMIDDFGWSRAVASGVFSANIITYGILSPLSGALTDRLGPRKVLTVGALVLGLGAILASRANAVWQFYLLWMLIAMGGALVGYVPHSVILANWFVKRRGAALGIFSLGFGLSFFSPLLTQILISTLSWRSAYLFWGLLAPGVIVPLALLFQRRRPQDLGLQPDGSPGEGGDGVTGRGRPDATIVDPAWVSTDWTLARALKSRRFWALFLAAFCVWGLGLNVVIAHQVALVVDVGYTELFATLVFAFYGGMNMTGTLGGFISDRLGRELTATLGCTAMVLGAMMLRLVQDASQPYLLYIYAVLFGLGAGLNSPTISAAAADLFQGRNFGSINGFIVAGFGLGGALGPYLGGLIYDIAGSYDLALIMVILATALAMALVWIAAPRKVRRVAGQARLQPAPGNLSARSRDATK